MLGVSVSNCFVLTGCGWDVSSCVGVNVADVLVADVAEVVTSVVLVADVTVAGVKLTSASTTNSRGAVAAECASLDERAV